MLPMSNLAGVQYIGNEV